MTQPRNGSDPGAVEMRKKFRAVFCAVLLSVAAVAQPALGQAPSTENREPRRWSTGGELPQRTHPLEQMAAFKTEVPAHDVDVVLARPTDHSITVSIRTSAEASAIIEYWKDNADQRVRTRRHATNPGEPINVELTDLTPGSEYGYRLGLFKVGSDEIAWGEDATFRTKPGRDASFSFVIQACSHLDQGVEPAVYGLTLANMLAAEPDFVIDLGDTFMTDKRGRSFKDALPQYDAQRYYLGLVARTAPLFMALGNHDGETGTSGTHADDIGPWSYRQRTSRFPEPIIDGAMYTGATGIQDGVGSNYYAFEWGDALFVVLDPYWSTTHRVRDVSERLHDLAIDGGRARQDASDGPLEPKDASWAMTLGRTQYDWLAQTLASTNAKYRFVFIHHLVGGVGGSQARGGVESSHFFEWGGNNADGTPGFAVHRIGWPMPIHDLLVKNHVSAVFHGHDHLHVHSERDGIQYQCVPQPGTPGGSVRTAADYGYASGTIMGSPGHIRVLVSPERATVEFIRTAVEGVRRGTGNQRRRGSATAEGNGQVMDSYAIDSAWKYHDRSEPKRANDS